MTLPTRRRFVRALPLAGLAGAVLPASAWSLSAGPLPAAVGEWFPRQDPTLVQDRLEPGVPVSRNGGVRYVATPVSLPVDAIEEGVDEYVAPRQPDFCNESLHALASRADEDPANDGFVLSWILADHQQPRGTIQPAAMKHRPPFHAKVIAGVDTVARVVSNEGSEGLLIVAGTEFDRHGVLILLSIRRRYTPARNGLQYSG